MRNVCRYVALLVGAVLTLPGCAEPTRSVVAPERAMPSLDLASVDAQGCEAPFTAGAAAGEAEDVNGDGVVCRLDTTPLGATVQEFAVKDNRIAPATQGGCPNKFAPIPYLPVGSVAYDPTDRNQDGLFCEYFFVTGSGRFMQIRVDNNVQSAEATS